MTEIRNYTQFEKSIRNFSNWMEGVSGGMDIDFMCERHGHFLFFEGKPWRNGVLVSYGQHKALTALSRQPNTRVYIVGEGKDSLHLLQYSESMPLVHRTRHDGYQAWFPPERFTAVSAGDLGQLVSDWWSEVSG